MRWRPSAALCLALLLTLTARTLGAVGRGYVRFALGRLKGPITFKFELGFCPPP